MHQVYLYSGISIDKLMTLDIYEYRVLLQNTLCEILHRTEEGRQVLRDYANITHEEFDIEGLKAILT